MWDKMDIEEYDKSNRLNTLITTGNYEAYRYT